MTRKAPGWRLVLASGFALGSVCVLGCDDGAVDTATEEFNPPEPPEASAPGS